MEQLANNNLISSQKIQNTTTQTSISQERHPTHNSSDTHNSGQLSNNNLINQANSSLPLNNLVINSIKRDNTPILDTSSVDQTKAGSHSSSHKHPPTTSHL